MNDDRRRDDIVHGWFLTEAPERAPAGLADLIRDQVVETRQEWPGTRFRFDLRALRLVAGGLALLALSLLAGIYIGSPHPGPSPTPSATAPASAGAPSQAAPSPAPTPEGVILPAGEVTALAFTPRIAFAVPSGWTLQVDEPEFVSLVRPAPGYLVQGDGLVIFDGISVYARPVAGLPDGTLGGVPGVGTSAQALATWLSERPQLTSTSPIKSTLAGLTAYQLDFRLSSKAGDLCGIRCANLLDSAAGPNSYRFGIEGDWRVRAFLLDAPDGSTILISIDDADGVGFEEELAGAMPILESLRFVEPPRASPSSSR
jgi:hypothetical protein